MWGLRAPGITADDKFFPAPELWPHALGSFLNTPKTSHMGSKARIQLQEPSHLVIETLGGTQPLSQTLTRSQLPHFSPSPPSQGGANSWPQDSNTVCRPLMEVGSCKQTSLPASRVTREIRDSLWIHQIIGVF